MKSHRTGDGERTLAVFIDFENVGLGFGNRRDRFSIEKVLERLVEKGKIVAKKAYADWSRFGQYAASLHAAAVELVEIPKRSQTGKNSADIRMCVDAMDLAYSKDHIDTFVIVSGDSDFSPLVSKLKELGKHVIGLGLADATSNLLRDNCDEFIYYEDLDRAPTPALVGTAEIPELKQKAFGMVIDALLALRRENKEVIYSSMVKDTIKRKKPSFNEEYHGYRTFSDLLEDAQRYGLLEVEKHKTSGTYVVTRFGGEMKANTPTVVVVAPPVKPPVRVVELPPRAVVNVVPALPAAPVVVPPPPQPPAVRREPAKPSPNTRTGGRGPGRPEPVRTPEPVRAPAMKPTAPIRDDDDEDAVPLGRALMEEVDDLDDVPSYRPRKPAPTTTTKPAAATKPVAKSTSGPKTTKIEKPVEKPAPARAVKPAPTKPPIEPPAPKPTSSGPASGKFARPAGLTPPASPPPPAPVAPKPKPPANDDDFGAGLL